MKITEISTDNLIEAAYHILNAIRNQKSERTFFKYGDGGVNVSHPQIQTVFDLSEIAAELVRRERV